LSLHAPISRRESCGLLRTGRALRHGFWRAHEGKAGKGEGGSRIGAVVSVELWEEGKVTHCNLDVVVTNVRTLYSLWLRCLSYCAIYPDCPSHEQRVKANRDKRTSAY
jgi:hypothetical protein